MSGQATARAHFAKLLFAALVAGAAALAQARAEIVLPDTAIAAFRNAKGPAAQAIYEFAKSKIIACSNPAGGPKTKCRLAGKTERVAVFYTPETSPEYALAALYYNPAVANGPIYYNAIFQRDGGGYRYVSDLRGMEGEAQSAVLNEEALMVTTATLQPQDAICCPSGRTVWRVDIATGQARYASGYRDPAWKTPR